MHKLKQVLVCLITEETKTIVSPGNVSTTIPKNLFVLKLNLCATGKVKPTRNLDITKKH